MFKNELQSENFGTNLVDQYGRSINYLRLSVTDRCNLRCFYCSGCENFKFINHSNILTYEEFLSLIGLSHSLQVSKVRLTGGEPFVRRDFLNFLEQIKLHFPDIDLRVTTNGTLLPGKGRRLKEIGLNYINISLDTLNRDKYARITGRDKYLQVREAIDECLRQEIKVKLNVVALRSVNDNELSEFLSLALKNPIDIRFIEFMPIGSGSLWSNKYFWSAPDILQELQKQTQLQVEDRQTDTRGPARMYRLTEGQGRIGVISPLSNHFCATCNRFRITPDGGLRTCLFSDKEYKLRPLLRSSKVGLDKVLKVMQLAGTRKPMGYELIKQNKKEFSVCQKIMSSIGG